MTGRDAPDTARHPGPPWTRPGRREGARLSGPGRPWRPGRSGLRLWTVALAVAVVQLAGSGFAARNQLDRAPLDAFARVLLLAGPALLLLRGRYPRTTAFGGGYPFGPIVVSVAIACFSAVVAGHRRAAWTALGMLWAGHLLIGHWLYRVLARLPLRAADTVEPPPGPGRAGAPDPQQPPKEQL